ncbi:unnamed protein product [Caretta caretta]
MLLPKRHLFGYAKLKDTMEDAKGEAARNGVKGLNCEMNIDFGIASLEVMFTVEFRKIVVTGDEKEKKRQQTN